jgi:carbamoyl-phosphate synthase small subunit
MPVSQGSGFLVLEDGTLFEGSWCGNPAHTGVGEVVFNTSMVGYQEILTDPSYYQQIIVMTTPEQGNYGVADIERESKKIWAEGFVCLQLNPCSTAKRNTLAGELEKFAKPALSDVDTRALVLHLRSQGTPWGALLVAADPDEARKRASQLIKSRKAELESDWVYKVTSQKIETFQGIAPKGRIAVFDFGAKNNIIGELQKRFKEIAVFGSRSSSHEILDWAPDGIMLTNGPGDPATVKSAVTEIQKLLGRVPIFGICMGHQLLGLALGGKTFKLKFGHRGANHPVRNLKTGEIYMTSQNHGYALHQDLPQGVQVCQVNLYDGTVEGIECPSKKAWSVQYHPEASPGPHDSQVLFNHFAEEVLV